MNDKIRTYLNLVLEFLGSFEDHLLNIKSTWRRRVSLLGSGLILFMIGTVAFLVVMLSIAYMIGKDAWNDYKITMIKVWEKRQ